MTDYTIPDDLSIPAFLRTTTTGAPCQPSAGAIATTEQRPAGFGPSCWEEMQREDSDVVAARELADAVKQYEDEKRLAAFQQWVIDNPELARMNRQAKRDAERRIARLGIPPASRRMR